MTVTRLLSKYEIQFGAMLKIKLNMRLKKLKNLEWLTSFFTKTIAENACW